MTYFVHPMADVQTENIGQDTRIWQFVVVLPGARIGSDVNICSHCFVENDVIIGDRVTIKNGVQLWDGLRIADEVFVGPNVTFTNDRYPRSQNLNMELLSTVVEKGASIGAGAVCGRQRACAASTHAVTIPTVGSRRIRRLRALTSVIAERRRSGFLRALRSRPHASRCWTSFEPKRGVPQASARSR